MLSDKILLITGGTGSFGNELIKAIKGYSYKEIRIFSRDELKQDLMRNELQNDKLKFYIGDVRNIESVDNAMKNVDLVFHAAALKQVPSCEFFPMQAVLTNIMGGNNVIESAIKHKVKSVICLSTDKAVYPINAMGMTKALMEKTALAATRNLSENETTISCVRYGNVMCSRGSVIPLFIKQIKEKRTITITEPGMTRFLLPLRSAIELVLFAFKNAGQGNIFIKKAPASTVIDLANALKNIFKSDVPVKNIGIRHGEKIFETLATIEELRRSQDMGDYFRVKMDDRGLSYSKYYTEGDLEESSLEDYTSHNTKRLSVKEVEELLLTLPEVTSELKVAGIHV
ncbi:MAG: UDP-glucose 4-epimerase [Candidatus Brocadia carolinensis]|uniref:UDP-glucose 4-epimerase n=1 Tax=Candidatus Brocadia carolinensis TaxID=1004156 RepID=A0A1V4AQE0_9BACT|nr:MAG: UDP-glucose 4-epimerase [Candidatus Brocadia caroliniensis]